jgi:hypothetical protein
MLLVLPLLLLLLLPLLLPLLLLLPPPLMMAWPLLRRSIRFPWRAASPSSLAPAL